MLADMSPVDIETISGVDRSAILQILSGSRVQVHWTTEEALLGVKVPEEGWVSTSDGMISSVGAMRRLQALAVQGFPFSVLAEESGLNRRTVREVRSGGRPRLLISRNRIIRRIHDRLWDMDPVEYGLRATDVARTRQNASQRGWYPTEAWADIDDPECKPVLNTPRYVALVEDASELIDELGYTRKAAAERLGVHRDYLDSAFSHYKKVKERAS
jgi:hypothetical protein